MKKNMLTSRVLKPLTFTALAPKPSTSIKSVKREKQRRQVIGIEGKKEKDVWRRRVRGGGWI